MAGEWRQVTFADVIELISGGTPKTSNHEYWGGVIPWLSIADFNTGYRWVSTAEKTITERGLSESATTILRQGDIIISARGTVGVVAQLTRQMAFNQSCYGIRGKHGIAETNFIYYALRYAMVQMQQVAHGGVFNTITRDTFKIITTKLPPLQEQRAIAHILGTLDDKIELNRRMSKTLEEMARAIFKSWFVDFDPVRANMERKNSTQGRQDARSQSGEETLSSLASSRLCGFALNPEIAALFPDSFEDSELGKIPRGWKVGNIQECCIQIQNGGTPRRNESRFWNESNIPWLTSGEVRQSIIIETERFITLEGLKESSAKWIPVASTVIALYGATAGKVSFLACPLTTNQAVCALIPKKSYALFNYLTMSCATLKLENKAIGSAQQNISKQIVVETKLVLPPISLIERFEGIVGPFFDKWILNLHQSHTLAVLRDGLLPKLISGELCVKDAERIEEEIEL